MLTMAEIIKIATLSLRAVSNPVSCEAQVSYSASCTVQYLLDNISRFVNDNSGGR